MAADEEDEDGNGEASNNATCRWVHMHGINFGAMDALGKQFKLSSEVMASCKTVSAKSAVCLRPPALALSPLRRPTSAPRLENRGGSAIPRHATDGGPRN